MNLDRRFYHRLVARLYEEAASLPRSMPAAGIRSGRLREATAFSSTASLRLEPQNQVATSTLAETPAQENSVSVNVMTVRRASAGSATSEWSSIRLTFVFGRVFNFREGQAHQASRGRPACGPIFIRHPRFQTHPASIRPRIRFPFCLCRARSPADRILLAPNHRSKRYDRRQRG
jgi:hypothetical protein